MLPFESTLTPDKMRLCAQAAALEMIKMRYGRIHRRGQLPYGDSGFCLRGKGLRGALSYSTMDEEGLPESIAMDAEEALKRTDSLYDRFHGKGNLKGILSPGLNSCSSRLVELEAMRARERGTMLQAHMNEYMGKSTVSWTGRMRL